MGNCSCKLSSLFAIALHEIQYSSLGAKRQDSLIGESAIKECMSVKNKINLKDFKILKVFF